MTEQYKHGLPVEVCGIGRSGPRFRNSLAKHFRVSRATIGRHLDPDWDPRPDTDDLTSNGRYLLASDLVARLPHWLRNCAFHKGTSSRARVLPVQGK
jgi:hypothetical protein